MFFLMVLVFNWFLTLAFWHYFLPLVIFYINLMSVFHRCFTGMEKIESSFIFRGYFHDVLVCFVCFRSCFTRAAASPAGGWRCTATAITSRIAASWTGWTPSAWRAAPGSATTIPTSRVSSTSWSAENIPSSSAGTPTTITWAPANPSGWWEIQCGS